MTKRDKLITILVIIVLISSIGSLIARKIFSPNKLDQNFNVALVGPMSGPEKTTGESMRRGAELFVEQFNRSGGLNGKGLILDVLDDKDSPEGAGKAAREVVTQKNVAVIGHWSHPAQKNAARVYEDKGLPLIALSSIEPQMSKEFNWIFGIQYDLQQQSRFLANYTRNVLGDKIVTIIHDDSTYGYVTKTAFEETYKRFGTKIRYLHSFSTVSPTLEKDLEVIVSEIKDKKDTGTLFLATRAPYAARIVKMVRDAGVKSQIVGLDTLATQTFIKTLEDLPGGTTLKPNYSNKIIATSPLLFDTAGQQAQVFKNSYLQRYGVQADWVAANAYQALQLIVAGLQENQKSGGVKEQNLSKNRQAVKSYLASLGLPGKKFVGITGTTHFNKDGISSKPIQIGIFSGRDIVAAMTQLQPLIQGSSTNYFDEIKKGRMLYVNDRFMYKTNVVYTGLEIEKISELNIENSTAVVEFALWFRYRGNFNPEEIIFPNAVEPILLTEPEESSINDKLSFKLFRIKGRFFLDFLDTKRTYGDHILGISFRHKNLDRNNLLYVVDVLGMELNKGNSLLAKIKSASVMGPVKGWKMTRAWISQESFFTGTFGKPIYVGFGSLNPEYSRIDLGTMIQEDKFNIKDVVPAEYFIYLGIFGVVGMLFAWVIDAKTTGMFWLTATWFLRCFFWPVTLLAIGNIILNFSIQHLSNYYTYKLVQLYNVFWWLIAARLASIALKRFIWDPLENRTEKKIPNVIRMFSSAVFYIIALCGITAFVFDQTLTSMLATGGLFTMIIGLAIQSNISNIFSGIVVNIERPFSVGDWIQIDGVKEGQVIDITWRTVRLRTWDKTIVIVPTGRAAEATTINLSKENIRPKLRINLSPKHSPSQICELLQEAVDRVDDITRVAPTFIVFLGIKMVYGQNVAVYQVKFWYDDYSDSYDISWDLWSKIWEIFDKHGILLITHDDEESGVSSYLNRSKAVRAES